MNNKNLTLRQKFISLNLRHKLVLLVFFCSIVPLSIMGGVTFFMMKAQMEQSLSDLLEETGQSTARLMDNYLLQRRVALGLVAGSSTLRAGNETQALFGLSRYIETFDDFDALLFADTRGNLVASAGNVLRTQGDANADQMVSSWVQEARQGATVLDRVTPQPGNISRYVVFIQPVSYEGVNYGWVFGQVDSEKVANISISVEIGETGRATLFNREGFLIGHQDKARYGSDLSQYPIMKNPVQKGIGNSGELFLSGDGRIKWGMTLMLSQSLEQLGLQWGIIVDQTEAELYAPVTFLNKVLWALWVVALIFTLILGLIYSSYITGPLRKLVSRLNNISSSEADLTQRLEVHSRDEVGQTAEAFNNVMHKLQLLITQVSDQTVGLARSSEHISKMAKATGKAIDQEQQEIEQVATAMNEMSATVQEVASNTLQAADAARKVVGEVKSGNQLVNSTAAVNKKLSEDLDDATQVINNLKDDSDNIGTILQVIHNIADQTNLLALNAAIEAARAGEQGRGFAVVADEVRTLAKRSNDATVEIQQIIEQLQTRADEAVSAMRVSRDRAEEGVDQSARAGQALGVISQAIDDINDMDHQIASATEEQSLVAEEINRSIHKVSKVADETAQQTSSMLEEINSIDQLAKQLKGIVAQFRVK